MGFPEEDNLMAETYLRYKNMRSVKGIELHILRRLFRIILRYQWVKLLDRDHEDICELKLWKRCHKDVRKFVQLEGDRKRHYWIYVGIEKLRMFAQHFKKIALLYFHISFCILTVYIFYIHNQAPDSLCISYGKCWLRYKYYH